MAVTYGFYNSINKDRKYNAVQMASIFDGIILDGVLMSIGTRFEVKALEGMKVSVGEGRCWFDKTWTHNDAEEVYDLGQSNAILDKIMALVIEVDQRDESRINDIKMVSGVPATEPKRPELIKEPYVKQYPIAYILVKKGVTTIMQSDITYVVGQEETPFVTAPLDKIDITSLVSQWDSQWNDLKNEWLYQTQQQQTFWEEQTEQQKEDWQEGKDAVDSWFASVKDNLSIHAAFDFDNLIAMPGSSYIKKRLENGNSLEELSLTASGYVYATRETARLSDGSAEQTVIVKDAITLDILYSRILIISRDSENNLKICVREA